MGVDEVVTVVPQTVVLERTVWREVLVTSLVTVVTEVVVTISV